MLTAYCRLKAFLLCWRSLGLLAPRLEDAQLRAMLQKLCEKCTSSSKKEEHRDIAVIGLKTVAQAITDSQADVLIDIVIPTLVASVAAKVNQHVLGTATQPVLVFITCTGVSRQLQANKTCSSASTWLCRNRLRWQTRAWTSQ
jgi:hypothetical protein